MRKSLLPFHIATLLLNCSVAVDNASAIPTPIISKETVEIIRLHSQMDRQPQKLNIQIPRKVRPIGFEKKQHQAVEKKELVRLPVTLTVYPTKDVMARFTLNENVFVVGNKFSPFVIPVGAMVLMNNRTVELVRPTLITGSSIARGNKLVRFDKAPGIAPAHTEFQLFNRTDKNQREKDSALAASSLAQSVEPDLKAA